MNIEISSVPVVKTKPKRQTNRNKHSASIDDTKALIRSNPIPKSESRNHQTDISNEHVKRKHVSGHNHSRVPPSILPHNISFDVPMKTNKFLESGESLKDPSSSKSHILKKRNRKHGKYVPKLEASGGSSADQIGGLPNAPSSAPVTEPKDNSVEPVVKKRKKNRKNKTIKCSENNLGKLQTNSNYPKELTSSENFSCNWKKMFQNIKSNDLTDDLNKQPHSKVIKNVKGKVGASIQHHLKSSTNNLANEIWFDGVDKDLLELPVHPDQPSTSKKENGLVRDGSFEGSIAMILLDPLRMTKAVAMDCEMVGTGENGQDSVLARVSIVNLMGNCIYDKFVKTSEIITNYRTAVSGIRPSDLEKGEDFKIVQEEVSQILDKRILVGHALHNDLKVLFLTHPRKKLRDTSFYKPFRQVSRGNTPSLKLLAQKLLGVKVQDGEHNSIQDAQAAMRLYTMHKKEWEHSIRNKQSIRKGKAKNSGTANSPTGSGGKKITNSPTTRKLSKLKI